MGRVSPDHGTTVTAGESDLIRIWDVQTGVVLQQLAGHTNWIRSVEFSPNGKLLASGSTDQTVRLWNLETGKMFTLQGHMDVVGSVAFSPSGKWLASCSTERTIRVWQMNSGKCFVVLAGHEDQVRSLS